VCAHYDSHSDSDYSPGADDNGNGVAAVIEAARMLSKYKFNYTVIYALWNQEENELAESGDYAKKSADVNDTLIGVINMDVIAFDGLTNLLLFIVVYYLGFLEKVRITKGANRNADIPMCLSEK
jgi:Zn-dependent M28 family amino/carboxypeptidase